MLRTISLAFYYATTHISNTSLYPIPITQANNYCNKKPWANKGISFLLAFIWHLAVFIVLRANQKPGACVCISLTSCTISALLTYWQVLNGQSHFDSCWCSLSTNCYLWLNVCCCFFLSKPCSSAAVYILPQICSTQHVFTDVHHTHDERLGWSWLNMGHFYSWDTAGTKSSLDIVLTIFSFRTFRYLPTRKAENTNFYLQLPFFFYHCDHL